MRVGIFGGSIRPGGGLTVLKLVTTELAQDNEVMVYTGAADSSALLRPLFEKNGNIEEVKFFHSRSIFARYLISKVYFIGEAKRRNLDWILSLNYYLPTDCRIAVYHINLLNFQRSGAFDVRKKIRDLDARVACKRATLNIFESKYLSGAAAKASGGEIHNPALLYVAVDPDFYRSTTGLNGATQQSEAAAETFGAGIHNPALLAVEGNPDPYRSITGLDDAAEQPGVARIVCVSSISPYKDNESVLKTLQILTRCRPEVDWRVSFAGGQYVAQWDGLKQYAEELGVGERVEFLGPISKTELSKLMNRSLCLLNCSYVESFCMVAVEAMASSCPVIVTNAAAMPESVADAGIIAAPGDCDAFSRAVIDFYDQPALRGRYIELGKERAENFRAEEFGKKLRAMLRDERR